MEGIPAPACGIPMLKQPCLRSSSQSPRSRRSGGRRCPRQIEQSVSVGVLSCARQYPSSEARGGEASRMPSNHRAIHPGKNGGNSGTFFFFSQQAHTAVIPIQQ